MPKLRFKDVNIHFTDAGKGPAVVLIHGFLENVSMWSFLADSLKSKRTICVDLPGHGDSDCIGYVHTMEEMAEAVLAVLSHLRIRRISLVGHSMGGYVALALAEKEPDMLKSLTLYHSTARADTVWKKRDRERAIDLIKMNHKSFVRTSIPMLFKPSNRKRLGNEIKTLKMEALKTPKQGIVAALSGMRLRPNREVLLKFPPFPVFIIAGDKDPRIPLQESHQLAEISEYVHLHVIKDCGHMSFLEDQESAKRQLRQAIS
jgi:pimeloyl-ACP methyl ester carboxylesterase